VPGICTDGPLAGQEVTVFNALGAQLTIGTLSSDKTKKQATCTYEVVALASADRAAGLRFVRAASPGPAYPQAPLRSTTDLGGTLDDAP